MATYFDDCSSLSGWTECGISGTTDFSISGGAIEKSTSNYECLSLNAVDSDADRQDADILVKVKISSLGTTHYISVVRGSDSNSASTASGYVVALRSTAIRTVKKVNGVFTQIAETTGKTHSANTNYWVRLRINGTTLSAVSWADGGSEGSWDCSSTDSSISGDGYCGLHGAASASVHTWSAAGVGTNGDTAPASAGGGATNLVVSDAAHAHAADAPDLTSSTALVIAEAAHAHIADNLTLSATGAVSLVVSDALHAHAADNLTLAASGSISLTVSDALHAHAADNIILTSQQALAITEALHAHLADNVALSTTAQASLLVADALHAHAADNLTLTTGGANLVVADALHAHVADSLALTLRSYLVVADARHLHYADHVPFGVISYVRDPQTVALLGVPSQHTSVLTKPARQIGALLKGQ